jgi:hypothetical protein
VTFLIFVQKGLLIDDPTTPTTALALGNGPLPFSDPLLFVIPSKRLACGKLRVKMNAEN